MIRRLDRNNFRVNLTKIQFYQNEVKVLGIIFNGEERIASSEKKKEDQMKEKPKFIRDLRGFQGSVGWFRTFIENFAVKTKNLTKGLKSKKKWK